MHVYFVRHGETVLNKKKIHQSPQTPLSPEGYGQVLSLVKYIKDVNPNLLLTSHYTRALETARVIGSHVGLTPKIQGLFYEVLRPSSLFGTFQLGIQTMRYIFLSFLKRNDPVWHYEDGENFFDVMERVRKAQNYLESLAPQNEVVVIVSHTVFISVVIMFLCKNRIPNVYDMLSILFHIEQMKNAGVIHIEYSTEKQWSLNPSPHMRH